MSQTQWQPEQISYMQLALACARYAAQTYQEVPVGAVLVHYSQQHPYGQLLATGFNQPIHTHDPSAHAEIVALRHSGRRIDNYRLPIGTVLYVTLEPCTMCVGALIHARVEKIVFATPEPRAGAVISHMQLTEQPHYNHQIEYQYGLLQSESQQILRQFFRQRRKHKNR